MDRSEVTRSSLGATVPSLERIQLVKLTGAAPTEGLSAVNCSEMDPA